MSTVSLLNFVKFDNQLPLVYTSKNLRNFPSDGLSVCYALYMVRMSECSYSKFHTQIEHG